MRKIRPLETRPQRASSEAFRYSCTRPQGVRRRPSPRGNATGVGVKDLAFREVPKISDFDRPRATGCKAGSPATALTACNRGQSSRSDTRFPLVATPGLSTPSSPLFKNPSRKRWLRGTGFRHFLTPQGAFKRRVFPECLPAIWSQVKREGNRRAYLSLRESVRATRNP
jgi:hypothetical protein